jgi:hypothetical protein
MIVELLGVELLHHNKRGALQIVSYKYDRETQKEREQNTQGLVFYFEGQYIQSFILTSLEVRNITKHGCKTISDLTHFLHFDTTQVRILDIGSCYVANPKLCEHSLGYSYQKIQDCWIEFNRDLLNENELYKDVKDYGTSGFQRAIQSALIDPEEKDYLAPHTLPNNWSSKTIQFDYSYEDLTYDLPMDTNIQAYKKPERKGK